MQVDYRYLKAFELTAKHLSFSKAAEELNIAQSAVSRQIKLLEESINEELIIRSSKKVLLTDKGRALYLNLLNFEDHVNQIFETEANKVIRIGTLHGLLETWLSGIISQYLSKYPNEVKITVDTPIGLQEGITNGHYDIIFTVDNIQNDLVSSLKLFNEKLVLISKKEIELREIQKHTWIVYDQNDHFFKVYKKRSNRIIQVNSMTTILQLVKSNVGIAIVPDHLIKNSDKLQQYDIKNASQHSTTIYMATLNYKNMPSHLKNFKDLINI